MPIDRDTPEGLLCVVVVYFHTALLSIDQKINYLRGIDFLEQHSCRASEATAGLMVLASWGIIGRFWYAFL